MGKVESTGKLKGDLGEKIFEHFCEKNNYAYISLEDIYNSLTPRNILYFRYGYHRIEVRIPDEITEEIRVLCCPSNYKDHEPSFTLDYLTVSLNVSFYYKDGKYIQKPTLTPSAFNWIEIKSGKGKLTRNQKYLMGKTIIPVSVFRVETDFPKEISVKYEVRRV